LGFDEAARAADMIRSGRCDAVLTGGVEATMSPLVFSGFDRLRAMTTRNVTPDGADLVAAMKAAIIDAGVGQDEIDLIKQGGCQSREGRGFRTGYRGNSQQGKDRWSHQ